MRRILYTGGVGAAVVVTLWRLVASLANEHRRLTVSGELGERLATTRRGRIARAVARERLRPAVRVPVHVRVRASVDIGDNDLLEASMRRAVRPTRPAMPIVTKITTVEAPADAPEETTTKGEFAWLEAGPRDRTRTGAGVLGPSLMGIGLAGSFVPLTRPLGDASPWFALGSAAFVVLGWWRARS